MNVPLPELAFGSIIAVALTLGIVQAIKEALGWDGARVKLLSIFVGFIIGGLAIAYNEGLIPNAYEPYILLVVGALAFGLSASGYYGLARH